MAKDFDYRMVVCLDFNAKSKNIKYNSLTKLKRLFIPFIARVYIANK